MEEIFTLKTVKVPGADMTEWYLLAVFVGFVMGFVAGVIYALRLYKKIEADCDRDWAKRHGMREMRPHSSDVPVRFTPTLRRRIL